MQTGELAELAAVSAAQSRQRHVRLGPGGSAPQPGERLGPSPQAERPRASPKRTRDRKRGRPMKYIYDTWLGIFPRPLSAVIVVTALLLAAASCGRPVPGRRGPASMPVARHAMAARPGLLAGGPRGLSAISASFILASAGGLLAVPPPAGYVRPSQTLLFRKTTDGGPPRVAPPAGAGGRPVGGRGRARAAGGGGGRWHQHQAAGCSWAAAPSRARASNSRPPSSRVITGAPGTASPALPPADTSVTRR